MSTFLIYPVAAPEIRDAGHEFTYGGTVTERTLLPGNRWSSSSLSRLPESLNHRRYRISANSGKLKTYSKLEKIMLDGLKELTEDLLQSMPSDKRKEDEKNEDEIYEKVFGPAGLGKRVAFLTGYLVSPFLIPLAMATVFIVGVFIYYNFIKY